MRLVERLREVLVPGTESGVKLACANCGANVDPDRATCPSCGSSELLEREGFEMHRPR